MKLKLISTSKVEYEGDVEMVILPGEDGEFGILPQHMEMIASLKEGEVRVYNGDKVEKISIKGGVASIYDGNNVDVMVE